MKETDVVTYTNRFNDLATLCPGMVSPEFKKIERYIWVQHHPIQGLVNASKLNIYYSAKRIAFILMNQEICRGTMVQKYDFPKAGRK